MPQTDEEIMTLDRPITDKEFTETLTNSRDTSPRPDDIKTIYIIELSIDQPMYSLNILNQFDSIKIWNKGVSPS
ncbi:hypothetical protein GWI33_005175 [Rhynchophorus ferrugineus]|uniref:Uncharacterized protein n=1 Tax=Rhynchophorus ferrugineus TaxID=354439 RepID=A0A834IH95_RHYFE|nr:hypothetical protein GWI33_005175 [Rhynchophorus ferrugineus]